jgi:hypothetical protein
MPDTAAAALTVPAPAFSVAKSPDDWLTPEAVEADYPAFTASRLTKLRMGPGGPAFTKIGRAVMYRRGDLLEWLKANSRTMTNERRPGAGRKKAVA